MRNSRQFAASVLQKQLEAIPILKQLEKHEDAPEFAAWHYQTRSAIRALFAPDNHQLQEFEAISYSLAVSYPDTPDGDWQEAFHAGLDRACALIKVFCDEHHAAASPLPVPAIRSPKVGRARGKAKKHKRFLVALSFPGEARKYVEQVAQSLAVELGQPHVLYDKFLTAELAKPNLDLHLAKLYRDDSLLLVPFLSADYQRKEWCQLEWRQLRDIIKKFDGDRVMPFRLDDTLIDGMLSIDGYVRVDAELTPEKAVVLILERLKQVKGNAKNANANVQHVSPSASSGTVLGRWYRHVTSSDVVARRNAIVGLLTLAAGVGSGALMMFKATYDNALRYPIELQYVAQWRSAVGYVLHLRARSTNGGTVYVPVDDVHVDVVRVVGSRDSDLQRVPIGTVDIFEKRIALDAAIQGLTSANTRPRRISCVPDPHDVFLLLSGTDSLGSNPSLPLQVGRENRSLSVGIARRGYTSEYLDQPIDRFMVFPGDDKTKVLER